MTTLFSSLYVVRLRAESGDGLRGLKWVLKTALRAYGLRALSVTTEQFENPGPRLCRTARRRTRTRFGNPRNKEATMDKADLDRLKTYAASTRSHLTFGGVPFVSFDWKSGKYLVGKKKIDITGEKLVADVANVMVGFRHWPQGGKPDYFLTRLLDPSVEQIERNELGQTDESQWADNKDPFVKVSVLPAFNETTRQLYIIVAAYGERSEVGNAIDAFVDRNATRGEGEEEVPIIQLCARAYTKGDGTDSYAMQLDVDGWTTRPAAVLKVLPPPLKVTETSKSNDEAAKSSTTDKSAEAKPKRKIAVAGDDMDDVIPF